MRWRWVGGGMTTSEIRWEGRQLEHQLYAGGSEGHVNITLVVVGVFARDLVFGVPVPLTQMTSK